LGWFRRLVSSSSGKEEEEEEEEEGEGHVTTDRSPFVDALT